MTKIIVTNESALNDADAMRRVLIVMDAGKISEGGNAYCYLMVWDDGISVTSTRTKKQSHKFSVFGKIGIKL